jgi:Na+-translocating ferredoxin:NAD+ oxidoreductase RnfG subunit
MRGQFLLIPLASVAIVAPAHATVYLTVEQAQQILFPGAEFMPDNRTISSEQERAIEKETGVSVRNRTLSVWRVSTGGWFIVDQVIGRHDNIPYALGLAADGSVRGIEILEYRESYGGQVREPLWRAQFIGKRNGAPLALKKDIQNISGATLSCRHIADGVKRLLATHAFVLAEH